MNDTSIKPIGSVQQSDGSAQSRDLTSTQAEEVNQMRTVAARQEKMLAQAKAQVADAGSLTNVSVHFRVDSDTNEVTIFLVDRQSKRVLRSIPSSELSKLQIGELLKLTV